MGVMEALKRPYERLTAQEVTDRFPALRLPAETVSCFTPQAGFLDAGRCVLAHLKQAQRFGATIHDQVRVDSIDLSQESPVLETSAGQYRCDRLIISPGPWASEILEELALPLCVTRQQKFYFPTETPCPLPARRSARLWRQRRQVLRVPRLWTGGKGRRRRAGRRYLSL